MADVTSGPPSNVMRRTGIEGASGPVADYAAFRGTEGRDTYFRPDRYQQSDLGPVGARVEVKIGGEKLECDLQDVSQSGVALDWPEKVPVELGSVIEEIVVRFDEYEAYRGQARVGSVRRDNHRMIVGASFVDTLMNIEDVLHLRDVKAWTGGSTTQGFGLKGAAWRTPGHEPFKAAVAELRLFLEDAQSKFGELEASLPWHVAHGEHDSPARDVLIERIRLEFATVVMQAAVDLDTELRKASEGERDALQEYSVRHLHDLLMQAPWMRRARYKPLGYAGDYEIMNGLYGNHFSGATLFAKALNLAFVGTPAAAAVRARKDLVKRCLSSLLETAPDGRPIRVLSIAAGPAQEVFELLQERTTIRQPLEIVLFDQDKRALTFSYGRLQRLATTKWQGRVNIVHLHDSIKRLLRGTSIVSGYGAFDAVFSCGLFDYLQPLTWISLCRSLFASVGSGGALYIGNMVPGNPCRWFMEQHLDWFLVYRERAEMLELAKAAAPEAQIGILEEATGVNPFVELKEALALKPQDVELEARWSAWLLERNRRGTRTLLWIVVSLYPVFGVLDYLVAPAEWLWLLYGTRAIVTSTTIAMFRISRSSVFSSHGDLLSSIYMVVISAGISLMTVFMGGLASHYYAGLTLTIVATGLLYVWPRRVVVLTHATIVATFVLPNVIINRGVNLLTATSNLFFLVSTAIIAGTGQMVAYRSQREQVVKQLIIERTKKNLEYAHDQLKRLDRFKSEFFANITHELKTPLTMMLAPLELMVDGQLGMLSPAQRSTLSSIQRSGVKLLRLIADLLDLSKLEESRLRLRVDEHDLVAYLRSLATQVEPLAQRKSIELSFATEMDTCPLWCDLERIERIFINLLSNATKFTPTGGHVCISIHDEGIYVRVDVQDTGIGFPTDMAETIFERFFQVEMAGTRRFGGAGIGLALAKELVLLHGGTIWAMGEVGQGATFSVRLTKGRNHFGPDVLERRGAHTDRPTGQRATDRALAEWQVSANDRFRLIEIDEVTEQRVVERDPDEARRPHSVLVVDDTVDVIRVVRLALHHELRVFAASDGQKGWELAQKHRPSVIITDLMMPILDGLELTQRIRADARTKHIPVLMLTARDDVEDRVAGLDTGVSAYLAKPFSTKELVSTVRALLATQAVTADVLLSQRMDSLETIAGGLAHEIRNPLNYVKNAVGSIQRDTHTLLSAVTHQGTPSEAPPLQLDVLTARMQKMFETAQAGLLRIATTVDLMVRYSREGYTRNLQPHDVFGAARDVLAMVAPTIGHKIAVSTEFVGEGSVECVPEELNQVLTNLIQNAMEAVSTDGTGSVSLRGEGAGSELTLSVDDNGVGIDEEDQAKIFAPFYSTKDVGRGMGMGLTITRRVIESLGGTIRVSSQLGRGTQFVIRLPRKPAGTSSRPSSPEPRMEAAQ